MKMTFSRKILAGFLTCVLILAAVAFFSFRNGEKFLDTNRRVTHTHEVLNEFDIILATSVDVESAVRGYVISGDTRFLELVAVAKRTIAEHLARLEALTADNAKQQERIGTLRRQIEARIQNLDLLVELRQTGFDKARDEVSSARGKELQEAVKQTIADAKDVENALLAERREASDRDARNFNIVFSVLLAVIGLVLVSVYLMITANLGELRRAEKQTADKNWILTASATLNDTIRGEKSAQEMAAGIIEQICTSLQAQIGVCYLYEKGRLNFASGYAYYSRKDHIEIGEGLAGQAALQQKIILFTDIPDGYTRINSALGDAAPKNILAVPLLHDSHLKGVIEIGSTRSFKDRDHQLLQFVSENLAIAISTAQSRSQLKDLLEETQRQGEELHVQQEELKQSNEELQEKTELLQRSEEELKAQQEELQQTNEELEEKANLLEEQKEQLQTAKVQIEHKAGELELTGRYKSEFLANMSHELRTPLNSILILSQLLAENKNESLGPKEIDFARNIHNSGSDLLILINEILDLSKIESGKLELDIASTPVSEFVDDAEAMFAALAKSKNIEFFITDSSGIATIRTDKQRVGQILKNLLSNAFKFTSGQGTVRMEIRQPAAGTVYKNKRLANAGGVLAITVSDTGIGIPADKLGIVFEAFQQADGSTKRKYGGTGLGLSISRELAGALGGEIRVESEEGKGSEFTLYLPVSFEQQEIAAADDRVVVKPRTRVIAAGTAPKRFPIVEGEVADDRHTIGVNDRVILIMEDDTAFSQVLLDFVRARNYKGIVAVQGNTGLSYARHYKPDAILLDMHLPVTDGAEVLKHLKSDPELRHIPVQIISGFDLKKESMELGAFDFLHKPASAADLQKAFDKIEDFASRKLKKLLIVEDNAQQNHAIRELIGNGDVKTFSAFSGEQAYQLLSEETFDCVIVDLGLPGMTGFELLEKIKGDRKINKIPVIIYTGKDLSREENARLGKLANTVVLKTADSQERLLDETMLFLHRVESKLPKEKQDIIRKLHKTDEVLKGKTVLLADDDIRNIYSLTNVLEEQGMHCLTAENGKLALQALQENPSIDIVLMDVMMPEMDGYEATRAIRNDPALRKLPVIALTAKAMKGDREKCLEAGMSDYVSKPVNIEQLLSLMRVWLYR